MMNNEIVPTSATSVALKTREQTEIEAVVYSAKQFPRNENMAIVNAVNSFKRESMANAAMYSFPRGGQTVQGCSVQAAREIARCWGNLHYGLRIIEDTEKQVHIKGFCYDAETNTHVEAEDKFSKKIQRKVKDPATGVLKTQWVDADERDLRELIGKRGAILVRNCILQIIPSDIVDDCLKQAQKTMRQAAHGELTQNKDETIKNISLAFDELGVSVEMLEKYLGHELSLLTEDEIVSFKKIYSSIKDGNSKREDYFTFKAVSKTNELNKKLKGEKDE